MLAMSMAGRVGRSTRNNGKGAGFGAPGRSDCSDHGDAIDMEPTSRFVKRERRRCTSITSRSLPIGSIRNCLGTRALEMPILFSYLDNFATLPLLVACKLRAEWTFSAKPKLWES